MLDRDGGLWMVNASGVRRVEIGSPVARHARAEGLRGGSRELGWEGATLWAATSQGLFARDASSGTFAFQPGSLSDEHALLPSPAGGWIVAAGQNFGEWRGPASVRVPGAPKTGLSLASDSQDPARVFVGGMSVEVYRRQKDRWEKEVTLATGTDIYHLASDESGCLWIANGLQNGLWRARATEGDWSKATIERLDGPDSRGSPIPAAKWRVRTVDGEAVIHGAKGLWRAETPGGRVVPDERFAGLPDGAMTPIENVEPGGRPGTIYLAGTGAQRDRYWRGSRSSRNEAWKFQELLLPELKAQLTGLERMLESPDGHTLWMGAVEGLFSVDLTAPPVTFPVPAARWRGVSAFEGGEVFEGGARAPERVMLPTGERAVKVEFSAAAMRMHAGGRTGVEFRTRAAGVDHDWTTWSATAARELTNLPPGSVQLDVQARNHLGLVGPTATMTLLVPPFWWETWWFRTLVVLVGVALVAAGVRWLVRRQFQQRIALLEAQAAVQNERLRIARDMHDDLGSTLAGIVHLSAGEGAAGAKPEATLARIHEATRD
jgi:ligand-binding sensor domain-containing protein